MKSTFSGLQFCRWQYGSISIRLAVVAFQMYEIARISKKIRTYSSSMSSKVINLGANRKLISNFPLVSRTVFEIFPLKTRKILVLPIPHPGLTPLLGWPFSNFVMEFVTRKLHCVHDKNYNPRQCKTEMSNLSASWPNCVCLIMNISATEIPNSVRKYYL